jgi:hypothetical protein
MEIAPLPVELIETAVELWRRAGLTRAWNDPLADLRRAMEGPASAVLAGLDGQTLLATALVGHMRACEGWLAERRIPKLNLMVRADNRVTSEVAAATP